ncbi:MAG TPA: TPM domain-containing protein [Acidimicrobiales bacterium]|nr:TPM domain-containing protein [Acidimicrobiales bacterium]
MVGRPRTKANTRARAKEVLSKAEHRRVGEAVDTAEETTGLQFCVVLGPADGDAHAHAEALFVQAGLHLRPAVLVLVAPDQRRVEVLTASAIRERVPDSICAEAVAEMTRHLASGDFVGGIVAGVERLAAAAGPGAAGPDDHELPDIMGGGPTP